VVVVPVRAGAVTVTVGAGVVVLAWGAVTVTVGVGFVPVAAPGREVAGPLHAVSVIAAVASAGMPAAVRMLLTLAGAGIVVTCFGAGLPDPEPVPGRRRRGADSD
jgi:hypothetical protein